MADQEQIIDAEVVTEGGHELVPAQQAPATLFRTDDPVEVLQRATKVADALKSVLTRQGLTTRIGRREHVNVEGWQTLGAMLGVTAVCVWTRKLTDPEGWEARVEARTLDGRVIGAAEAECLRTESEWRRADDYALRSMAQTRATSKALGSVLRFVVTLAGYEGTPAEEMPSGEPQDSRRARQPTAREPQKTERPATAKQRGLINARAAEAGLTASELATVLYRAAGQEPRTFDSEERAKAFVDRQLDRLPARLVDAVLDGISEAADAKQEEA